MIGRILKSDDFFKDDLPKNKFDLVKDIPRVELIALISAINHTIKPPLELNYDLSIENQFKMIELIYQVSQDPGNRQYSNPICQKLNDLYRTWKGSVSIFTRVSCLYSLNEVIHSKEVQNEEIEGFKFHLPMCLNIFKFLLICNDELLSYSDTYKNEITPDKLGDRFFEAFMFKEIPHNQYYYIQNPFNLFQRGVALFNYIKKEYALHLDAFLKDYNITSPEEYIAIITKYFFGKGALPQIHAFKIPKTDLQSIERLDKLSQRGKGNPNTGLSKFDFLEIKKSPLYKAIGKTNIIYIVMDNSFLIEKSYELFFWDFYFDQLKINKVNIKSWGSTVGYFFEEYADSILKRSFEKHRDIIYKTGDDVIINGEEFVDYYIRRKRQIILVQAKRSFVPQLKYKEVYSLKDYESLDKEEFYRRFGLNQLVEMSIMRFKEYSSKIDSSIPKNKLFIYPVLLVNEPIVSSAITTFIFNKKFEELLKNKGIALDSSSLRISRLTIMHIGDLERLEQSLIDKDIRLDKILQTYSDNTDILLKNDPYAPFLNFDQLIKKKIKEKALSEFTLDKGKGILKIMIDFLKLK